MTSLSAPFPSPFQDMWGNMVLSPVSIPLAPTPVTSLRQVSLDSGILLGKRKSEGRRTNPINRGGSRYRGVTHHARTNRYESHIWDDGRQVYLGGFYNEEQAALAYDLAAVNFRGKDAVTNFPAELYHEEAAASGGGQISREAVVSVLREQSKTMNKVDSGSSATVNMEPWEVQLTAATQPTKMHLGVYATEIEAARAYDRALISALGLEAASLLNFPLLDYLDQLDANQAQAAVHRDLLPPNVPLSFKSSPLPVPLFQVPLIQQPTALGNPSSSTDEALIPEFHVGGVSRRIQGDGYVAPGWKSITPRSVLGNDRVATTSMEGQGSDAMVYAQVVIPDSEEGDAKRHKIDHDLQSWVDALMLDS